MAVEVTPLGTSDRQVIQSYGNGGFRVSDRQWRGAILVFPDHTLSWGASSLDSLGLDDFAAIREATPAVELLLVGTGLRMALLRSPLKAELRSLGIAVETMDTGAACRTYNLLMAEERRVAAALLPVG